jgi:hypothetical protein
VLTSMITPVVAASMIAAVRVVVMVGSIGSHNTCHCYYCER